MALDAGRDDTPWYPQARLFRQRRAGDWNELFARMAASLPGSSARYGAALAGILLAVSAMSANDRGVALVPIAFGELIDKITILEIKSERIRDPKKAANIRNELDLLTQARARIQIAEDLTGPLKLELKRINAMLWDIEDRIRDCERDKNFGPEFIELARSVYRTNDRSAEIKRQINELAGSAIVEEKSYRDYK